MMKYSPSSGWTIAALPTRFAASTFLVMGLVALVLVSSPAIAAGPSLRILSPANNAIIGNGSPVSVVYLVSNFNLTKPGTGSASNPNEGHVNVVVDGMLTDEVSAQTIALTLGSGIHDIRLRLVTDNGTALNPDVNASVAVTVTQGPAFGKPGIRITYPTEGLLRGTDNAISFDLTNFALVPPGGPSNVPNEGHIRVFVDGRYYEELTEYEPAHMGLDDGRHTIRMQLVDNGGSPLSPDTFAVVNFTTQTGLGRGPDYMPILAYANGGLVLGILALLLVRKWRSKR